jgi:hypothetical protein
MNNTQWLEATIITKVIFEEGFCKERNWYHLHTYVHKYIHTHIHTYIHTYIHVHKLLFCEMIFISCAIKFREVCGTQVKMVARFRSECQHFLFSATKLRENFFFSKNVERLLMFKQSNRKGNFFIPKSFRSSRCLTWQSCAREFQREFSKIRLRLWQGWNKRPASHNAALCWAKLSHRMHLSTSPPPKAEVICICNLCLTHPSTTKCLISLYCVTQGCQLCLGTPYQNVKKYTK